MTVSGNKQGESERYISMKNFLIQFDFFYSPPTKSKGHTVSAFSFRGCVGGWVRLYRYSNRGPVTIEDNRVHDFQ